VAAVGGPRPGTSWPVILAGGAALGVGSGIGVGLALAVAGACAIAVAAHRMA
jgi:hypothetical protein